MLMNPLSDRAGLGREDAELVARAWPIILLAGLVSIVFGILILTIDWSVDGLATFVGILFIIQGLAWIVTKPLDGGARATNVFAGILGAGTGVVLIAVPDKGLLALGTLVGIWIVIHGLLNIVGAIGNRHLPHWWLVLVLGLFELPIGIWAMRRPGMSLALIITLSGVWAVVNGIWQCVVAVEVRNLPRRLGRLEASTR
jgi:uncharacterized membrane protein HdeD (DUF308 family)